MRSIRLVLFMTAIALLCAIGGCKKVPQQPATAASAPQQAAAPQPTPATAQQPAAPSAPAPVAAKLPGGDPVGGQPIKVGYIFWGGDIPTFYGNGGLSTRQGTIFAEYHLNFQLFAADDTEAQIKMYESGETPFLRMTFPTVNRYLARLCPTPDAATCPDKAFQLTWSAGDHLVCRENITDIKQLKDKSIAIQQAGPHESFLFDILRDVGLNLKDVKIVWSKNISGDNSPPDALRKTANVDCAFAVSPDMMALTGGGPSGGGLTSKGTGAEGSVKGAHVLVSTSDRRKSIPDVYFVRHDFNVAHHDLVTNFAAAYLKSVEKVTALRHDYDDKQKGSEELRALLAFAMQVNDTWKSGCPSEADTYGLLQDASFVGLAGNIEWDNPQNPTGHKYFSDLTNDLAAALGVTTTRVEVPSAKIDWTHAVFNNLTSGNVKRTAHFNAEAARADIEKLNQSGTLAENTMLSFVAYFDENQVEFDETKYGTQFDEVIKLSAKYTRAPIVIRGHTDTTLLVSTILRKGMATGRLKQAGSPGNFTYSFDGKPLDLQNARQVLDLISQAGIDDDRDNPDAAKRAASPSRIADAAKSLSLDRANQVRNALIAYATKKGVKLDASQIQVVGAGASDPFVVKPRSADEAAKNRRVEFSIVRVSAEAATSADYEL